MSASSSGSSVLQQSSLQAEIANIQHDVDMFVQEQLRALSAPDPLNLTAALSSNDNLSLQQIKSASSAGEEDESMTEQCWSEEMTFSRHDFSNALTSSPPMSRLSTDPLAVFDTAMQSPYPAAAVHHQQHEQTAPRVRVHDESEVKSNSPPSIFSSPSISSPSSSPGSGKSTPSYRRSKLNLKTINVLRQWFLDHQNHPYPTDAEKQELAQSCNISLSQLSTWFVNTRRRLFRPWLAQQQAEAQCDESGDEKVQDAAEEGVQRAASNGNNSGMSSAMNLN